MDENRNWLDIIMLLIRLVFAVVSLAFALCNVIPSFRNFKVSTMLLKVDNENQAFQLQANVKERMSPATAQVWNPISAHVSIELSRVTNHGEVIINTTLQLYKPKEDEIHSKLFHNNALHISDGKIIILYSGYYYLYSNVLITLNTENPEGIQKESVCYHYILCKSKGMTSILLRGVHTFFEKQTAYLGGIFLLMAGDEVIVSTSQCGVVEDGISSYVGLVNIRNTLK
ncbi:uncharacterized protein LOC131933199 [Physella acuta]|uniref:uncharacterized protein LOC131933199 n=1 Tax=Physella acuta TaxID=109671 RepID=UPI0027DB59C5|nr:uncharacterized protein LOC131933199 [Physella acuta]